MWSINIGDNETKVFPLVVWDDVYRPKSKRGLGIRKNNNVNNISITKLCWRIFTSNDSVWAKIMHDKYIKNNKFFYNFKEGWRFYCMERNSI